MKTMKLKLLGTIVFMSAIIMITAIPVNAQRRSRSDERSTISVRRDNNVTRSTVQQNSRSGNYNNRGEDRRTSLSSNTREDKKEGRQKGSNPATGNNSNVNKSDENVRRTEQQRPTTSIQRDNQAFGSGRGEQLDRRETPKISQNYERETPNSTRNENYESNRVRNNRDYGSITPNRRDIPDNSREARMNSASKAHIIYNLDKNDRRYSPGPNYRGSEKYWSGKYGPENRFHHNDWSFYRNYDYIKYHHWDRYWENYRWNYNSWIDYYNYYRPYSYRFHKYYYYDPIFGHVIRRFIYNPVVFYHDNIRYYCYDGYFFRYRRGVGYILVDIPFGMAFSYLPRDYERVYINGYLYFRVGNLFFEFYDNAFRLVHYPERYFAYGGTAAR